MSTIVVKDKGTLKELTIEVWEGIVLFTPDTEFTMLLERDEVVRISELLSEYLEATE